MLSNVKKAYYYLQKNGIEDTFYAALERLISDREPYSYVPVSPDSLAMQRKHVFKEHIKFSIVVPTYETPETYLREMIQSVLDQTYSGWELIIADASRTGSVSAIVSQYVDSRIQYIRLAENKGISANTNAALKMAGGDYIGLLDHDDILTPDALYECAIKITDGHKDGKDYVFVYSDEDKCNGDASAFFEPNFKPEFNLDLLLSNNYICHFLVMKANVMKRLGFRATYDGAQDHDIVLRAYAATVGDGSDDMPDYGHISKVLYHWRCHSASTAANPMSKQYAYDAGLRAVQDYLDQAGIDGKVIHTKHNGFFRVEYADKLNYPEGSRAAIKKAELTNTTRGHLAYITLLNRYDIGAIGGPVINKGKITGGIIDSTKTCVFDGLNCKFSGYLHRAVLQQSGKAVDVRNMMVAEALVPSLIKTARNNDFSYMFNQELIDALQIKVDDGRIGAPFVDVGELLTSLDYEDIDYLNASVYLGREIALEGYLNYYDPYFV